MERSYDPSSLEKKWHEQWQDAGLYRTPDSEKERENFMLLTEFPYPSGNLHIGHWYAFALPDMLARYLRMTGRNVLYPIGFDAFGLPAENAAIQRGVHPEAWTRENIATMTEQLRSMGASFDWSRAVSTIDPAYYRWTQWMFLRFFEKGLAYRARTTVNWCPKDKTVLANEQVVDGACDRCGTAVQQQEREQWMLKTTAYAAELASDLQGLDYPESTKAAQRNWIGPSEGAEIIFRLNVPGQDDGKHSVAVFTTRPDTLFGCTYLAVSPELAKKWMDVGWEAPDAVRAYVDDALSRRELERLEREKTGVDSGVAAINPVNGGKVPVWVADYVLGSYGTGAIMAVPAHDERDFEFAEKFGLPVRQVIEPAGGDDSSGGSVYAGEGVLTNSGPYDGLDSAQARTKITAELASKGHGSARTTYRLRDWILSRQRYWGCPIPLISCKECGFVPVPDEQLPVELPPLDDFRPADDGRSPLAKAAGWVKAACPKCGGDAERETDTMDTFVDSSWYFLRYADPDNGGRFAGEDKIGAWLPVPMYVGGAEHNTMHLLYSRFWTRALNGLGLVPFAEPYLARRNHGVILGPDGQKMSKSRGNVIDPDEQVAKYGADTVRMYLAFMAPYEQGGPWDPKGITGVHRFLKRFWAFVHDRWESADGADSEDAAKAVHRANRDIGDDLANLRFNTAVSSAMIMLNALETETKVSRDLLRRMVRILAPMAPHMAEELWRGTLGEHESVHVQKWPEPEEDILREDEYELPVQVNGKLRGRIVVGRTDDERTAVAKALQSPDILRIIGEQSPKKTVFVAGRMLNILVDESH
ncbi:MAG TPA: leucine--tRNA ligase [Candidatus Paceibacterota bacterium]|nr:leucine--tRNA ligase [Candidatus Paceibacterota bacterium]